MDKEVLSFVVEKTHELMNAASCSKEAKASAQTWLDAVGTENEAAATKTYIAELEADIMPVDGLIGFAESEMGAHFDLDKGRIARSLSELEEKGLVRRLINEKNKRQKFVSLTVRGNQVLEEIHRISGRWDEICFAGFTEEERGQQQDYLRRIAENAIEYKHRVGECTYGK